MRIFLLSLLLLLLPAAWGRRDSAEGGDSKREMCFSSCHMILRQAHFNDMGNDSSKLAQACLSNFGVVSLYLCLQVHCDGDHETLGFARQNQSCTDYVHAPLPGFDTTVAGYTGKTLAAVRRLQREEVSEPIALSELVIPSERLFKLSYNTLDAWEYVFYRHHLYGMALYAFWAVVVLVGVSSRLMSRIKSLQRSEYQPLLGSEPFKDDDVAVHKGTGRRDRPYTWLKQHITVPATFGNHCAQPIGWCTVPPRIQSLTILAFILINLFFCLHGYRVFRDNMYWPDVEHQIWRYLSDRTGIISLANFPLIWLFGMRNNLLMWLTGWDFGTYNNFHRWVARVATVQAVVHSVGYTVLVCMDGGWAEFTSWWSQTFWWTGELATMSMCLLLGLSVFWLRRNAYEFFLIAHVALSILILLTMYFHVSIFRHRYDPLVTVPVLIWTIDRLLRALRILAFNPLAWRTFATVSSSEASNVVNLTIPTTTSLYSPTPGSFYYLHILSAPRPWESHPFTVASVEPGRSMTFLVRPYSSATARLRDVASPCRVLVDGPYGAPHAPDLAARFGAALFVVGGSGVAVALSHGPRLPVATRVVWAVREAALAEEVGGQMAGFGRVDVFVTTAGSGAAVGGEWPEGLTVQGGRPDVRGEIESTARAAQGERLAVVACGPGRMADEARKGVVEMLGRGFGVEYFEESFGW